MSLNINTIWLARTDHKLDTQICTHIKAISYKFLSRVSPTWYENKISRIRVSWLWDLQHFWASSALFPGLFWAVSRVGSKSFQRHEQKSTLQLLWLILSESLTTMPMEKFILFCSTTQPSQAKPQLLTKYETSNTSFISKPNSSATLCIQKGHQYKSGRLWI